MLTLRNQKAKLANVNLRGEKHGNDTVAASDLAFAIEAPNQLLEQLAPGMLAAFYMVDPDPQQKALLPGEPGRGTKLRFPMLGTLALELELVGAMLEIPHGIGPPLELEATVNAFKVDLKEGGTVLLSFRAQFHPGAGELDILAAKIQQTVELTLTPPRSLLEDPKP